jgi:hypothetical protein
MIAQLIAWPVAQFDHLRGLPLVPLVMDLGFWSADDGLWIGPIRIDLDVDIAVRRYRPFHFDFPARSLDIEDLFFSLAAREKERHCHGQADGRDGRSNAHLLPSSCRHRIAPLNEKSHPLCLARL